MSWAPFEIWAVPMNTMAVLPSDERGARHYNIVSIDSIPLHTTYCAQQCTFEKYAAPLSVHRVRRLGQASMIRRMFTITLRRFLKEVSDSSGEQGDERPATQSRQTRGCRRCGLPLIGFARAGVGLEVERDDGHATGSEGGAEHVRLLFTVASRLSKECF